MRTTLCDGALAALTEGPAYERPARMNEFVRCARRRRAIEQYLAAHPEASTLDAFRATAGDLDKST